ncbi:hypothetical protein AB0I15_46580, partial [Nonomuraea sp. NPDC050643]
FFLYINTRSILFKFDAPYPTADPAPRADDTAPRADDTAPRADDTAPRAYGPAGAAFARVESWAGPAS